MATIVKDFPPEEETPSGREEETIVFEEDDEALARRLQAEWDASDAAESSAAGGSPLPNSNASTEHDNNNNNHDNNNHDNNNDNNHNGSAIAAAAVAVAAHNQQVSVATVSNPWEFDAEQSRCSSCQQGFHAFNRRHHCRLCGKIFCHNCSDQRALLPPSSIVLTPAKGGKKAKPPTRGQSRGDAISFSPDPDPDRMLTYVDEDKQLLYGKGLEER